MDYLSIRDIEPKHEGSKKLFNNPVLDKLSRSHISIPISMLVLIGVLFIYWGTVRTSLVFWQYIAYYLIGLLSFTLFEYLMHRYLYHMVPTSRVKGWLQYNLHGVHHEYPKDKSRLAMPPAVIIIAAFLFLYGFKLVLGDLTFAFTPGFMAGYAGYLSVHYIVHAYQPPKNMFKTLWINHSIHHYKDPDVAFGVSSPLWDHVFRTLPKKRKRS